jgi:transposase
MSEVIRIGVDTSKSVFQLHGVDAAERPVLLKKLRRGEMRRFFGALPATVIGLEACGGTREGARFERGTRLQCGRRGKPRLPSLP